MEVIKYKGFLPFDATSFMPRSIKHEESVMMARDAKVKKSLNRVLVAHDQLNNSKRVAVEREGGRVI